MAFVSTCSCGFRSEPGATSTDAIDAYRAHEKGHAPGQRRGEVEEVAERSTPKVRAPAPATADQSPPGASRKAPGRRGRAPAPADVPAEVPTEGKPLW